MVTPQIRNYYTAAVEAEWHRLMVDLYHRLEFDTTMHFLARHLPKRGLILDAGGGPGRYSLALAKQGYTVVLLDLTPENLAYARRQIIREAAEAQFVDLVEGSICDMSCFPDNRFDGVICLGGPLSHLLDAGDRAQALQELARVAKPQAPVFVSVMGRLAALVTELSEAPADLALPHFPLLRDTGDYDGSLGFTACHFFLPEELEEAIARTGALEMINMVGLEGIGSGHAAQINQLAENPQRWAIWYATHLQLCTHPAVVGMSEHMLAICRKSGT